MALPTPLYILLKNLTYITVEGASSVTLDDAGNVIEVYDMETHRDLFDAGSIGRAWVTTTASYAIPPVPGTSVPESFDDRLSHEGPRPTPKNRTMLIWWSGAGGTGDQIAMCWADQFLAYSGGIPRFVQ
jgi:hypothetical protein